MDHRISLAELRNVYLYLVFLCCRKGSKSGASMKCAGCQGSGMKVSIRQFGPSMIQQMQHPCNDCKGTGETINDKDRCPQCKGEKVVQEKKVLEVHVEKGMQNGQKITFPGEADEAVSLPNSEESSCILRCLWSLHVYWRLGGFYLIDHLMFHDG